jgi:hypothetical protein
LTSIGKFGNTMIIPTTPFHWRSWDCFTLANWVRSQQSLPAIDAQWVYAIHPTHDTFTKDALLHIVRVMGTHQRAISHLNILLLQSINGEYTLGTALVIQSSLWVVLMGANHAHCIPLGRLPIASITAWQPLQD